MVILHGENTVASRQRLAQCIENARSNGKQVVRLEAKHLDVVALEQALGSESLFGEAKTVIIEELHSLPKSKKKDELIEMVAAATASEIILWEKKDLSPTMLKKFPGAKNEQFKVTNAVFKWLDSLSGEKDPVVRVRMLRLLQDALRSDDDFMCFTMLIRQIRLLLEVKEGGGQSLAPFMVGKLRKQTSTFTQKQLLWMHHKLLEIDIGQKTSTSLLALNQELELLMMEL